LLKVGKSILVKEPRGELPNLGWYLPVVRSSRDHKGAFGSTHLATPGATIPDAQALGVCKRLPHWQP
jgi:hypothetical protein